MNKVQRLLLAVKNIIKNPKSIGKVFDYNDYYYDIASKKHKKYLKGLPVVDILELCPTFREKISLSNAKGGSAFPIDLALLKNLARKYENCSYLEIGTLYGMSVANVASVAKNCVTIDLPPAELKISLKHEGNFEEKGYAFFSKNLPNVQHIRADSKSFDFTPFYKKMDLIFIDGGHSYECVKHDTEIAFKLMKDDSSMIVWHDYLYGSNKIRWEVFNGILDGCPRDEIKNLYYVSDTLCVIYSRENFNTKENHISEVPERSFSIDISGNKLY